jgi:DNA polymerase-3 subunit gamma/tau
MAAALQLSSSARLEGGKLIIRYDDKVDCGILKEKKKLDELTVFATDFFQQDLRIKFNVPHAEGGSTDSNSEMAVQKERKALKNDPLVLAAVEIFNGSVGPVRTGPQFRKSLSVEEEKLDE